MTENEKFKLYKKFLLAENKKYNLTGITDEKEIDVKHFEDSLSLGKFMDLNGNLSLCDVGSGAGFPALPLKIRWENLKTTLVEGSKKKTEFLKKTIDFLNLKEIETIYDRAENIARTYEEKFDICTARAVAPAYVLLELMARMTKTGGKIVLYKGDKGPEEAKEAAFAAKVLNLESEGIDYYELSGNAGKRYLLRYSKTGKTPDKYPRRWAAIKRSPLRWLPE